MRSQSLSPHPDFSAFRRRRSLNPRSSLIFSPAVDSPQAEGTDTENVKEIRILLVDDQSSVRRGLTMRLQLEPDITIVGEAEDGRAAVEAAKTLHPDVLVMDYEMPKMDGIEATKALTELGCESRVVMLSIHDNATVKQAAAGAGVHAFVAKHQSSETLLAAIRSAARA
jgi:DNA-binding NarL/FixJ family response regulator